MPNATVIALSPSLKMSQTNTINMPEQRGPKFYIELARAICSCVTLKNKELKISDKNIEGLSKRLQKKLMPLFDKNEVIYFHIEVQKTGIKAVTRTVKIVFVAEIAE